MSSPYYYDHDHLELKRKSRNDRSHRKTAEQVLILFINRKEMHMKVHNLLDLLIDQLKEIYSAEKQLIKQLPKIVEGSNSEELQIAIRGHLEETKGQLARLDKASAILNTSLGGKICKGMQGLLEEASEALKIKGPSPVIDAAIIAAAQRIEHYEISAYGTAKTFATVLDYDDVANLLSQTLDEESGADELLTQIAESKINEEAATGHDDSTRDRVKGKSLAAH